MLAVYHQVVAGGRVTDVESFDAYRKEQLRRADALATKQATAGGN